MKIFLNSYMLSFLAFVWIGCGNNNSKRSNENIDKSHLKHAHHKASFKVGLTYADSVNNGIIPTDTLKKSIRRIAMNDVGTCHVHIEYGSPGVRGRSIWGGLVAYDEVWVAGAHNATSVRFSKPVEINGKQIDAGTYAFFAIPGRETWTLILNTRYKQHLADEYNADEDVVRLTVSPHTIDTVQRLSYIVEPLDKGNGSQEGFISLLWETVQVKMPFKVIP